MNAMQKLYDDYVKNWGLVEEFYPTGEKEPATFEKFAEDIGKYARETMEQSNRTAKHLKLVAGIEFKILTLEEVLETFVSQLSSPEVLRQRMIDEKEKERVYAEQQAAMEADRYAFIDGLSQEERREFLYTCDCEKCVSDRIKYGFEKAH